MAGRGAIRRIDGSPCEMVKKTTVSDVAQLAGASLGTVSRVLNGHEAVNPELRTRVLQAVEELGYRHVPRQRRKSGPGGTKPPDISNFGVVFMGMDRSFLERPTVSSILHGIETTGSARNLNLILANIPELDRVPKFLRNREVPGLLVKCSLYHNLRSLQNFPIFGHILQFPLVWILAKPAGAPGDLCSFDHDTAGALMAEHLFEKGHRNVAVLNSKRGKATHELIKGAFLLAGGERGMQVTILEPDPMEKPPVPEPAYSWPEVVAELMDQFYAIDEARRPTAICVPADGTTVLLYRELEKRGITPGRGVSIISLGNAQPFLAGLTPALTTVDIQPDLIGCRALDHLLWKIARPAQDFDQKILIEPLLVEGESVAQV